MKNPFNATLASYGSSEESSLMTPPELAVYLGIGRNTAYHLLNEGIIKGFRIGNQWKVSKMAVDMYIAKCSGLA